MSISYIVGTALLVFICLVALWALLNIIKFLMVFHCRKCKHCGHIMSFRRYRGNIDGNGESYDFYCEHCGAWDRLSREEMFGDGEADTIN